MTQNVQDYGATGDTTSFSGDNAAITASDNTLTVSSSRFSALDVGKEILVRGAGIAGADLVTDIASFTSATEIELTTAAGTTVTNAEVYYGTDDTVAIQNAINATESTLYDSVFFPGGRYMITSTITLRESYITLFGSGSGSTTIERIDGTFGDSLHIASSTPSSKFTLSTNVKSMKIRCNTDMTTGALLLLEEVTQSTFSDLFLENGFISLHTKGIRNCMFSDFKIEAGKYYTSMRSSSKFVYIDAPTNNSAENTENGFTNFNWTFTINANIEYGLHITECDGLWFGTGHIMGAKTAGLFIDGASTPGLTGLRFINVWFDGHTQENVRISGTPTGSYGDFTFGNCTFSGFEDYSFNALSNADFDYINITGGNTSRADGIGMKIAGGETWNISSHSFYDIDRDNNTDSAAIKSVASGIVTDINVASCNFAGSPNLDSAISNKDSTTSINISGNDFTDITPYSVSTTSNLSGDDKLLSDDIRIDDDAVEIISFGKNTIGIISVTSFSDVTESGTLRFKTGPTAQTQIDGGGADFEVTTGALSGTTGTDGKTTVSVGNDNIYIENRNGSTRRFMWKLQTVLQ